MADETNETEFPLTPDPEAVASELQDLLNDAQGLLGHALELARHSADESMQIPTERLNLLEAAVDAIKGEIPRLRHATALPQTPDPEVGADSQEDPSTEGSK